MKNRGLVFSAGLAVAAIGAGCSSNNESAPSTTESVPAALTSCAEDAGSNWSPTPINIAAEAVARALGVTTDKISHGTFGPVTCDEKIDLNTVADSRSIVYIRGLGYTCLAIGTMTDPAAGTSDHLMVVCPEWIP